MPKEEIEKEAEAYADRQIGCGDGYYEWTDVKQAYIESAEPRERRIEELEKENAKLKEKIAQSDELSSELIGDGLGYIGLIKQAKEIKRTAGL